MSESATTWREAVESLSSLALVTESTARSAVRTSPLMMSAELIVFGPPEWLAIAVPLRAMKTPT